MTMLPTELSGVANAGTESMWAWALEEPEPPPPTRRGVVAAALAGALAVIAAAGAVALTYADHEFGQAAPVVVTVTPEPEPIPMPPPITVADVPDARRIDPPPPPPPDHDQQFVDTMLESGIRVIDRRTLLDRAHRTCELLREGATPQWVATELLKVEPEGTPEAAATFVVAAMFTYPNCP